MSWDAAGPQAMRTGHGRREERRLARMPDLDHDETLRDLLDHTAVPYPARADLLRRMAEPHRRYHALGHLLTLWARHRRYGPAAGLDSPRANLLVGSAIAFHDAVYVGGGRDNERRSADFWRDAADPALSPDDVTWVADTILCTADHLAAADAPCPMGQRGLRVWVLDLDLTPLGEAPAVFAANARKLRDEQTDIATDVVERNRLDFLRRVAAYPRIYRSDPIAAAFENAARRNIAHSLGCTEPGSA